jgi:uncharacterized protein YcaQ
VTSLAEVSGSQQIQLFGRRVDCHVQHLLQALKQERQLHPFWIPCVKVIPTEGKYPLQLQIFFKVISMQQHQTWRWQGKFSLQYRTGYIGVTGIHYWLFTLKRKRKTY